MNQQRTDGETNKWASYYALMMEQAYEREIKEAIEKVKSGAVLNECQKRHKRGY